MKIGRFTIAAHVLVITAVCSMAQSYSLDKVPPPMNANNSFALYLPYPVIVGRRVLQPGSYTLQPLYIAGSDLPVLTIRRDGETSVNVSASISPTFTLFAPSETQATYVHVGNHYYFDRIWVRGLNYGYKFRLPKHLRRQLTPE